MRTRALLVWCIAAAATLCVMAQESAPFYFPDDERLNPEQTQKPTTVGPKIKPQLPQKPTPTQVPPTQPSPSQSTGKSLQMCRKYAETVKVKVTTGFEGATFSVDTCPAIDALITNGTIAKAREFPHMALIGNKLFRRIKWYCGGSLISERFVLSAAHCNERKPKRVRLGDYNIKSTTDDDNKDASSVEFDIIQIIQHPEYDAVNIYNDITLYKLDRIVVLNEYIRPICLHTEYELPPRFGIISGWGHTEFSGAPSDLLLKGNVSFVPEKECSESLDPVLKAKVKHDIMICAANFVNGTDTCQGDSGGPLQYRLDDPYCMYSQVGITSFGIKCGFIPGQKKYPAIYTRVSKYVPWIESIVWP